MQMIPISPTKTLIREIAYAHPDDRREMRAARYLNRRIPESRLDRPAGAGWHVRNDMRKNHG